MIEKDDVDKVVIAHEDKVVHIKAKKLDLEAEEINFNGRVVALEELQARIMELEVKIALLERKGLTVDGPRDLYPGE